MFTRAHRFHLIVDVTAIVAALALLGITGNPLASTAGFAILALHAIAVVRYPKEGIQDERDIAHKLAASRAGMIAAWIAFVLVATTLVVTRAEESVPTWVLAWMVWGGWAIQSVVTSVVALALDHNG